MRGKSRALRVRYVHHEHAVVRIRQKSIVPRDGHAPHVHAELVERRRFETPKKGRLGRVGKAEDLQAMSPAESRVSFLAIGSLPGMMPGGNVKPARAHVHAVAVPVQRNSRRYAWAPGIADIDRHHLRRAPHAGVEHTILNRHRLRLSRPRDA